LPVRQERVVQGLVRDLWIVDLVAAARRPAQE
jgi:hypothetical protein